jgi:serine/threonine-protein kinase Chk2
VILEDHSTTGTYVNGKKVGKGSQVMLIHKDELTFAMKVAKNNENHFYIFYNLGKMAQLEIMDLDEGSLLIEQKYHITQTVLGVGHFAQVKLAFDKTNGCKYAVKVVDKSKFLNKPKLSDSVMQEIDILKTMNHSNIIKVFDVIDTKKAIYLFLELVGGGELFHYIVRRGKLAESEARYYFFQMLDAIKYMHERNVAHRDLKVRSLFFISTTCPFDFDMHICAYLPTRA